MRERVAFEARSWLSTPFHHCADVKGVGVDCAMLLVRTYCDLGLVPPFDPRPYKPQWFLHSSEPRYLNWLGKFGHRVERADVGDVLLFKFGLHAAHGAIVVDERTAVHAHVVSKCVTLLDRRDMAAQYHSSWSVFP